MKVGMTSLSRCLRNMKQILSDKNYARRGEARHGTAWQGKARRGKARHGEAWQGRGFRPSFMVKGFRWRNAKSV